MRLKFTTILGYTAMVENAPSLELNGGQDRMKWLEDHMVSTNRNGHWNIHSCEKVAQKMGIVDRLSINHHSWYG